MEMLTLPFPKEDGEHTNGVVEKKKKKPKATPKQPTPEPEIFTGFNYLPMEVSVKEILSKREKVVC